MEHYDHKTCDTHTTCVIFLGINPLLSNYFDNRFIPFHPHSPLQTVQKRSHFGAQIFFLTGNSARGDASKEKRNS